MSEEHNVRNLLMTKESGAHHRCLRPDPFADGGHPRHLVTFRPRPNLPHPPPIGNSPETWNQTMQAAETLQDDETGVVFDLSEINVPEGFMIGQIDVILYLKNWMAMTIGINATRSPETSSKQPDSEWRCIQQPLGTDSSCHRLSSNFELKVLPAHR